MGSERYIEKLQRERGELLDYVRKVDAWKEALDFAATTGRKGSAYQEADRLRVEMNDAYDKIRAIAAEKENV